MAGSPFTSTRDSDSEAYTIQQDGTGLTRLTARFAADDQPAWSPDGTMLAFRSHRDVNTDIYVMNSDGTGVRRVTTDASADSEPTWAPDGQRLAFTRNARINVIGLDGTGERPVASGPFDRQPAWSPDGAWIAFTSTRTGNGEIFAVRADGSFEANLTERSGADSDPTWSPDGTRIAHTSSQPTPDEITMPASGLGPGASGATVLTSDASAISLPAGRRTGHESRSRVTRTTQTPRFTRSP
jgi:Tol biopolymer transport system component